MLSYTNKKNKFTEFKKMTTSTVLLFWLMSFCFTMNLVANKKDSTPGSIWLTGYETYEKAEKVYAAKEYSTSLAFYKKALVIFNSLSSEYPTWNRALIRYRIQRCLNKIADLNKRLLSEIRNQKPEDLVNENLALQTQIVNVQTLLLGEQKKLKSTMAALKKSQVAVQRNNNASDEFKNLFRNKIKLEKKYALLSTQIETLSKNTNESEKLKNLRKTMQQYRFKLDKTLKEKKQFQQDKDSLAKQYQKMSIEKTRIALAHDRNINNVLEYKKKFNNSEKKIDNLNSQILKLRSEKKGLYENSNEISRRLKNEYSNQAAYNKTINTENPDSNRIADALKTENIALRKEIDTNQLRLDELLKVKQAYTGELTNLKSKYDKVNFSLALIEKRRSSVEEEAKSLKNNIVIKTRKEKEYIENINNYQQELTKSKNEYKLLAKKYSELDDRKDFFNDTLSRSAELIEEKNKLQKIVSGFQKQIQEIEKEKKAVESAQKTLKNEHDNLLSENKSLKTVNKKELKKRSYELLKANEKMAELAKAHLAQKMKIKKLLDGIDNTNNEFSKISKQNNQYNKEISEASVKNKNLKTQYNEQLKIVEKLQTQINASKNHVKSAKQERDNIHNKLTIAQNRSDNLESEHIQYVNKIQTLLKQVSDSKTNALQMQRNNQDVQQNLATANSRIVELETTNGAQSKNINKLIDSMVDISKKIPKANQNFSKINKKLSSAYNDNTSLQAQQAENLKRIEELLQKINKSKQINLVLELERNKVIGELNIANKQLTDLRKMHLDNLSNTENVMAAKTNEVNLLINSVGVAESKIESFKSSNKSLKRRLEESIDNISSLRNNQIENLQKIRSLVSLLEGSERKNQNSELNGSLLQEKFIVLNAKLKDLEQNKFKQNNMINELLANLESLKEKPSDVLKVKKKNHNKLIATNNIINRLGNIQSGQAIKIKKLLVELANNELVNNKILTGRVQLQNKLNKVSSNIENLEYERANNTQTVQGLLDKVAESRRKFENSIATNERLSAELLAAKNKNKRLDSLSEKQAETINKIMKESKVKGGTILQRQLEYTRVMNELEATKIKISDLKQAHVIQLNKIKISANDIEMARKEVAESKHTNSNTIKELGVTKHKVEDLEAQKKQMGDEVKKLLAAVLKKTQSMKSLRIAYQKTQQQLSVANSHINKQEAVRKKQLSQIENLINKIKQIELKDNRITELALLQSKQSNAAESLTSLNSTIAIQKLKIQALLAEAGADKKRLNKRNLEQEKNNVELLEAQQKASKLERIRIVQVDELGTLKKEIKTMQEEAATSSSIRGKLQIELSKLQKDISILQERHQSHLSDMEKIVILVSKKDNQINDLKIQYLQTKEKYSDANLKLIKIEKKTKKQLGDIRLSLNNKELEITHLTADNNRVVKALSTSNKLLSEVKSKNLNTNLMGSSKIKKINKYSDLQNEILRLKSKINSLVTEKKNLDNSIVHLQRKIVLNDILPTVAAKNKNIVSKVELNKKLERYIQIAENAINNNNNLIAFKYYKKISELLPEDISALKKTGLLALELDDYKNAKMYLEQALKKKIQDIDVLVALGFCYLNESDLYKALSVFSKAASIQQDNPELLYYLGVVCGELGWFDAAVRNLEKALKFRPKSAKTAYNLAVVLLACDPSRSEEARKWYDAALTYGAKSNIQLEKKFNN